MADVVMHRGDLIVLYQQVLAGSFDVNNQLANTGMSRIVNMI